MDAIIYFYKKRKLHKPEMALMYREGYLLVKVGLWGDQKCWFDIALPRKPELPERPTAEPVSFRESDTTLKRQERKSVSEEISTPGVLCRLRSAWQEKCHRHQEKKERREKDRQRRQEYARKLKEYDESRQEYAKALEAVGDNMGQLVRELTAAIEAVEQVGEVRCVYEDSAGFLTETGKPISGLWAHYFQAPVFREYTEIPWVFPLLQEAKAAHFILLGTAECVPEVLGRCARRMKSLCWCLREEDVTEEVLEIVEDFYEDSGLAVTLRPRRGKDFFRFPLPEPAEPVCILDFTPEEKVFGGGLAPGSLWLDFMSVEEKERRLSRLAPHVRYLSQKQRWRLAKRESQIETNFTTSGNSETLPGFL